MTRKPGISKKVCSDTLKCLGRSQGCSGRLTFTCKHKYSLKRFLVRVCFGRRNEWSAVFWALLLSKQHSKQAGRSLCFDHLFYLLLPAHAAWQPAWAKSSRQNRWSMHTHRQECHLRKRKNIALGTFLNSGLAQWANKKIQASSHHMHTLTSEHKKNKWRNTCEVLRVFDFTLHLCTNYDY